MNLKKHSIGFNVVSSTNGVVTARGVKSKPNDLQVFGFTHEVGEGEKSPDNPYILQSLDSGAMSTDGVGYEHSIKINNNDRMIQVPTPIPLNSVEDFSDRIIKKEDVYYVEQNIKKFIIDDSIESNYFIIQNQRSGIVQFATRVPDRDGRVANKDKIWCDKLVSLYNEMDFYEHIRNPNAQNPNSIIVYLSIRRMTKNSTVTEDEVLAYLKDNPLTLLYQVENPYYLRLSDYAQQLLNSFELQNDNTIFVEGLPEITISGYLQK